LDAALYFQEEKMKSRNSPTTMIGLALTDEEFCRQLLTDPHNALADKGLGSAEVALFSHYRAQTLQELAQHVLEWEIMLNRLPPLLPVPNLNPALGYRQMLAEVEQIVRRREAEPAPGLEKVTT